MSDKITSTNHADDIINTRLGALEDLVTTFQVKFPELLAPQVAKLKQPCKTEFTTSGSTGGGGATPNGLKTAERNALPKAKAVCATNPACKTPKVQRVVDIPGGKGAVNVKFAWTCE